MRDFYGITILESLRLSHRISCVILRRSVPRWHAYNATILPPDMQRMCRYLRTPPCQVPLCSTQAQMILHPKPIALTRHGEQVLRMLLPPPRCCASEATSTSARDPRLLSLNVRWQMNCLALKSISQNVCGASAPPCYNILLFLVETWYIDARVADANPNVRNTKLVPRNGMLCRRRCPCRRSC